MSEVPELTLKQILDSPWVRRIARGVWIVMGFVLPSMLGGIGWVLWANKTTSESANATSKQALSIAQSVSDKLDNRSEINDDRATNEQQWRDQLTNQIIRLNQRVSLEVGGLRTDMGELKGQMGELKGLIVRQSASAKGDAAPFPIQMFPDYKP